MRSSALFAMCIPLTGVSSWVERSPSMDTGLQEPPLLNATVSTFATTVPSQPAEIEAAADTASTGYEQAASC